MSKNFVYVFAKLICDMCTIYLCLIKIHTYIIGLYLTSLVSIHYLLNIKQLYLALWISEFSNQDQFPNLIGHSREDKCLRDCLSFSFCWFQQGPQLVFFTNYMKLNVCLRYVMDTSLVSLSYPYWNQQLQILQMIALLDNYVMMWNIPYLSLYLPLTFDCIYLLFILCIIHLCFIPLHIFGDNQQESRPSPAVPIVACLLHIWFHAICLVFVSLSVIITWIKKYCFPSIEMVNILSHIDNI